MTRTLPAPILPLTPCPTIPVGCLCPWPTADGCQTLRKNLALWWETEEPEGDECGCACHTEEVISG